MKGCSYKHVIDIDVVGSHVNVFMNEVGLKTLHSEMTEKISTFIYDKRTAPINTEELLSCFKYLYIDFLYTSVRGFESDSIILTEIIGLLKDSDEYKEIITKIGVDRRIFDSYLNSLMYKIEFDGNVEESKAIILDRLFRFIVDNEVNYFDVKNNMVLFTFILTLLLIDETTKIAMYKNLHGKKTNVEMYWNSHVSLMNRMVYINRLRIPHIRSFIYKLDETIKLIKFTDKRILTSDIVNFYLSVFVTLSTYTATLIEDMSMVKLI